MSTVRHKLIIRHTSEPRVLLVSDRKDGALPSFDFEDRHTAEVDYINTFVRMQFGLTATVLRSLRHDTDSATGRVIRVHELEVHDRSWSPPAGLQWSGSGAGNMGTVGDRYDAEVLSEWIAQRQDAAVDGSEWTVPGWWDEVRAWLDSVLGRRAGAIREIAQLRAWTSCVVLVRTDTGDFYFKALPISLQREWRVMEFLARQFPQCVPHLVDARLERRWLLLAAFPGRKLEEVSDPSVWGRAVAMYADLQVRCMTHTDTLRRLGCGERSVIGLADAIERLIADTDALLPDRPEGLSRREIDTLHAALPALRVQCSELVACGIPDTLEHGDLWPGNFLVNDTASVLIDWEDAGVGHPFFGLAPLTVGLTIFQPNIDVAAAIHQIRRAYITAFSVVAPTERVETAIALAEPLALFEMALRYRQQPAALVRLHPWMRTLVPDTLRMALGRLALGRG